MGHFDHKIFSYVVLGDLPFFFKVVVVITSGSFAASELLRL